MEQTKLEKLAELKTLIVKNIADYNEALHNGNLKVMNELDVALKQYEANYSQLVAKHLYDECLATENPIKTAIERYSYNVLGHKDIRVEDVVTERVLKEDRVRQIDLLKFCKYTKETNQINALSTDWIYTVMKFNQLLCMRSAKELKFTDKQINDIASTFYMKQVARDIELGKTPDSNTQICKQLQTCVNEILFIDDGNGKNSIKVNNHDVAYLLMLYTTKGHKALSIQVSKHDTLCRLIVDVIYRILTNAKYSLEYKEMKAK